MVLRSHQCHLESAASTHLTPLGLLAHRCIVKNNSHVPRDTNMNKKCLNFSYSPWWEQENSDRPRWVNSLAPGGFDCSCKLVNFKLISMINIWGIFCEIVIRWMPQYLTTLVQVMAWCLDPCRHMMSLCHNELKGRCLHGIQIHALTHWGRVMHVCVGKLPIIGSDNGLSPGRRQAIIWTNAGISLIGPLGTNFSEISIEILTFSFKKMCLKVSSTKWRPFCLGLNALKQTVVTRLQELWICVLSLSYSD